MGLPQSDASHDYASSYSPLGPRKVVELASRKKQGVENGHVQIPVHLPKRHDFKTVRAANPLL
jgi:hypothetical protein